VQEPLNLTGIRRFDDALGRTQDGTDAINMARRLGLWTEGSHKNVNTRESFPENISELTPAQLSNLYSKWTADYGRLTELCGALNAQQNHLKIRTKHALAVARANIRRNLPSEKKAPSVQAVNDEAEQATEVTDLTNQAALIAVVEAYAQAAKEATAQYLASISREISFRDAQLKARIYE